MGRRPADAVHALENRCCSIANNGDVFDQRTLSTETTIECRPGESFLVKQFQHLRSHLSTGLAIFLQSEYATYCLADTNAEEMLRQQYRIDSMNDDVCHMVSAGVQPPALVLAPKRCVDKRIVLWRRGEIEPDRF